MLPLVDFVERTRGLTFKHSVRVMFLTGSAFAKEQQGGQGRPSQADRRQLEEDAETLRALGLARVDGSALFTQENTLNAAETLAFYDSDKKEVFINGTGLDLSHRVTVAHELTHALQDQYFDLNALNSRAQRAGTPAALAMTALIEGDAVTVENAYVGTLKPDQQQSYYATQNQQAAAAEGAVSTSVPAVLQALSDAPYTLGPTFVQTLLDNGGKARLNRAFRAPPTTDAEILDPARFLARHRSARVATPSLRSGERRVGSADALGALGLYFTLAARVDRLTALKATNAWTGDRFVRFTEGSTQCLRDTIVTSSSGRADLVAALEAWAAGGPRSSTTIEVGRPGLTLRACDPGGVGVAADPRIMDAAALVGERAVLVGQALTGGLPPALSQCVADRLVADPFVANILNLDNPSKAQLDEFSNKTQDATSACSQ